jgi:hypothetical protein
MRGQSTKSFGKLRIGSPLLVLVLAALVAASGACRKASDTLILVDVSADSRAGDLSSLQLTAPGADQTFMISGLSTTPVEYGLYLPPETSGSVNVSATAWRVAR